ncbi:MAG: TylF/MycF/NovP-related O-methyltransferase [Pseudomonadota bacterium]
MIELPDIAKKWDYENGFYLTADKSRMAKFAAHLDLYRAVENCQGAIVECGIFKGASFSRFLLFKKLYGDQRQAIGFDIFGKYPETAHEGDKPIREKFIKDAGEQSIAVSGLRENLSSRAINDNVELVEGDICKTVPDYCAKHPGLKIALLNLDTDIYEPAKAILEHLYPRIIRGGVLILDDYGVFPGETQAVDEYFKGDAKVLRLPYCQTPCFMRR